MQQAGANAPKNGYCYVYVSNESDEMVYFDNLQVTQNHARIIEENHYYAYGLKIAAISSKKMPDLAEGHITNKDLYNDKELIDDADLNWYDYGFRSYDPQIGRFPQLDPLTWDYPYYTPYQYAGNEPIANIDLDGLEPWQTLGNAVVKGVRHVAPVAVKAAPGALNLIGHIGGNLVINGIKLKSQTAMSDGITSGLPRLHDPNIGKKKIERGRGGLNEISKNGESSGPPYYNDPKGSINIDGIIDAASSADKLKPVKKPEMDSWDALKAFGKFLKALGMDLKGHEKPAIPNDGTITKFKQADGTYQKMDFDGDFNYGAIREKDSKTIDTLRWNRKTKSMDTTKTIEIKTKKYK